MMWLLFGLSALGVGGAVVAAARGRGNTPSSHVPAASSHPGIVGDIDPDAFVEAFQAAWAHGARNPEQLRLVIARVLYPGETWPPRASAHESLHQVWRQLGELVAAAMEVRS